MTAIAPVSEQLGGGDAAADGRRRGLDLWGDRVFRTVALAAGLSVLAILALDRDRHDQAVVADLPPRGPALRHEQHVGSGERAVRCARVHLRHRHLVGDRHRPRGADEPRHRALHHRARAAAPAQAGRLRRRPPRRDPVGRLRALGARCASSSPPSTRTSTSPTRSARSPALGRLFGGQASGASFFTAGLVLAVMITPIITAISREVLATIAQDDKNAALAMGATRWEMLACRGVPPGTQRARRRGDARARAGTG